VKNRKVAVIMGSDSDMSTMQRTIDALKKFKIEYEVRVLSAHRSPKMMHEFAGRIDKGEFAVVIAGAGGAAHLPGVIAALTSIPVIGVPMETPSMHGQDSLYSIVQMPSGVPVATMSIGKPGAYNAGILAAEILALDDEALKNELKEYKAELERTVREKNKNLNM